MRRYLGFLIAVLAFTSVACPPAPPPDPPKKIEPKNDDDQPPKLESLDSLKPRIEGALAQVRSRELLVKHGFWTVFHGILGTGLEKTMLTDPKTKKQFNAVDYLCRGGELRGLKFVPTKWGLDVKSHSNDRPDADLEEFYAQGHQDQFIAEMAQWGMKGDRRFRVGDRDYPFDAFINHATMRASTTRTPPQELSWAIIIIAQFHGTYYQWTNSFDEAMDFDKVVRYELDASINEAACGGTHRLFGLTWAYNLHMKTGGRKEGVWNDVAVKLDEHKLLARKLQNPDGTFSTDYFKGPDHKPDIPLRIGTTGHILEWLALAMTDEELRAPWMQNAVSRLSLMILEMGARDMSVNGGALYHAAHGLHLYHERVFGPPSAYLPLPPRK